jgi:hypothetical protein
MERGLSVQAMKGVKESSMKAFRTASPIDISNVNFEEAKFVPATGHEFEET